MPSNRDLEPFRRFYAEGGYVKAPSKRLRDLELAYNSQYFAKGGAVPGYAGGGPELFGALRSYVKGYKDLFDKPISVAFWDSKFPKIVGDQRLKSQFETGTSEGMYSPDTRALFEKEMFGIPEDIDPALRPIYGHIADRSYPDVASSYGNLNAVLDPSVNKRSSFFFGDSLGFSNPNTPHGPYWKEKGPRDVENRDKFKEWFRKNRRDLLSDNPEPFDPTVKNLLGKNAWSSFPGSYIEAQIQGGVPWSDVAAIVQKHPGPSRYVDDGYGGLVSKIRSGNPVENLAADLQARAKIGDRPAYGYYPKVDEEGDAVAKWLKAQAGGKKVEEIPTSQLSEIGYAGGGDVFGSLRRYIRGYNEPIKAWHGSPHDFDKFSSEHIGKGEGNQIYGHGLYFAEEPSVAKFYRDTLGADPRDAIYELRNIPGIGVNASPDVIADQMRHSKELRPFMNDWDIVQNITKYYNGREPGGTISPEGIRALKALDKALPPKTGKLYGVDIHENPENFLSLDKNFYSQGETGERGLDALKQLDSAVRRNPSMYRFNSPMDHDWFRDPMFSTKALERDIPGVRYLDAMSRKSREGTQNYVTFPGVDDILEITSKQADGGQVPGYAGGGRSYAGVSLPNLPNSMPQSGPMHYGSDEGMAGGGLFRWVKNLANYATPVERNAMDAARKHMAATGNEAMGFGDPHGSGYHWLPGAEGSVPLPPEYHNILARNPGGLGTDVDYFTAHSHPLGDSASPSTNDIGFWGNRSITGESMPEDWKRQKMWIAAGDPHGVSMTEPYKDFDKVVEAQENAKRIDRLRVNEANPAMLPMWQRMWDFMGNQKGFNDLSMEDRKKAMTRMETGLAAYRKTPLLPTYFDPDMRIWPNMDLTVGEGWPEFIRHLTSKDMMPFAEGGPVMTPPENMGKPSDLELGYNSQFFADGGSVRHHRRRHRGPIETDLIDRMWLSLSGVLGEN